MTLTVNQTVSFYHNGTSFEGTVKKINRKKAKVLLTKGNGRFAAGKIILVPYSMLGATDYGWQVGKQSGSTPVAPPVAKPAPFNPSSWWVAEHHNALQILEGIYSDLSPENLCCDGEASQSYVRSRRAALNRQMNAVFTLLGQEITEGQLYEIIEKFPKEFEGSVSKWQAITGHTPATV